MQESIITTIFDIIKNMEKKNHNKIFMTPGNNDIQLYYIKNKRKYVIGYVKKSDCSFSNARTSTHKI